LPAATGGPGPLSLLQVIAWTGLGLLAVLAAVTAYVLKHKRKGLS
jgi:hypothetical protein